MQMATAGDTLDLMHVERHRALGAIGRKNRRSGFIPIGSHPPPGYGRGRPHDKLKVLQRHLAADFGGIHLAAIAGEFHRAAVHHREIVAELAGKVEILFDQHDRDIAEAA
jgi:hypothetical protein